MAVSEEGIIMNRGEELMDLPPGFRFHPTDEEIITYYLKEKVLNSNFTAVAIGEADLNKCEPWDLPRRAKMGENNEFYFFCQRDRKYPTGMRTNRATESGYWKATGKDKEIYKGKGCLVGMKKTLVFYRGRAPRGEKTNWVMHEYRLEGKYSYYNLPKSAKDEWVVCRVLHKNTNNQQQLMIKKPIEELMRIDSFDNIENLLDFSPLPPLMDPNFPGQPGPSFSISGEDDFKPINNNNNNNTTSTTINNNSYHPRITLQNPNFPYPSTLNPGLILGSGLGYGSSTTDNQAILRSFLTRNNAIDAHYEKNIKLEHSVVSVSQETCLSSDVNAAATPEISSGPASRHETMPTTTMMSSGYKSYDDLGDMGILWD